MEICVTMEISELNVFNILMYITSLYNNIDIDIDMFLLVETCQVATCSTFVVLDCILMTISFFLFAECEAFWMVNLNSEGSLCSDAKMAGYWWAL